MSIVIVYTRPDGELSICNPGDGRLVLDTLKRDIPPDASLMDASELPADRLFRGAWIMQGGFVIVDMSKARGIHRQRLREAREPLLRAADVDMTRALDDPGRQAEIEARRQALRDVTDHPDIEAAQTPEELSAVWPLDCQAPARLPAIVPESSESAVIPLPVARQEGGPPQSWALSDLLGKAANELPPAPEAAPDRPAPPKLYDRPPPAETPLPATSEALPEVVAAADDATRRRIATTLVAKAVDDWLMVMLKDQPAYEMALQASNDKQVAVEMLTPEAEALGITVRELAMQIISTRQTQQRRMAFVRTVKVRSLAAINNATGDQIDAIAAAAAAAIRDDSHYGGSHAAF